MGKIIEEGASEGGQNVEHQQQQAAAAAEAADKQGGEQTGGESADEITGVVIGDEQPPAKDEQQQAAPQWVKDLREQHRKDKERIKELEAAEASRQAAAAQPPSKKPALADFDYDEEKYEAALTKFNNEKIAADQKAAQAREAQLAEQKSWQEKLDAYGTEKKALKVQNFDDAEAVATSILSVVQQGIIVQGSKNPALTVYALGNNPAKLSELAAIKDPVKFAFAVAQLETQMKVQKKAPPAPEKQMPSGKGNLSGTVDSTLEGLRKDAEKTGDYTKVRQYKANKRAAAAGAS